MQSVRLQSTEQSDSPEQEAAGEKAHLIRVMPNTPCLVGASASAMCLGGQASEEDGEAVRTLFDAVGTIFKVRLRAVPQRNLVSDALTSANSTLSGCEATNSSACC